MPLSSGTLKCVLWNCRNFGRPLRDGRGLSGNFLEKARYIMDFIERNNIDIACLMETSKDTIEYFHQITQGQTRDENDKLIVKFSNPYNWSKTKNSNNPDYKIGYTEEVNKENYLFIVNGKYDLGTIYWRWVDPSTLEIKDKLSPGSVRAAGVLRFKVNYNDNDAGNFSAAIGIGVFHAPASYGKNNLDGRKKIMRAFVDHFESSVVNSNDQNDKCDFWIWSGDFNYRLNDKENEFQELQTILSTQKGYSIRGPLVVNNNNNNNFQYTLQPTSLRHLPSMVGMAKSEHDSDDFANPFDQVWAKRAEGVLFDNMLPYFQTQPLEQNSIIQEFFAKALSRLEDKIIEGLKIFITGVANVDSKRKDFNVKAREETFLELVPNLKKMIGFRNQGISFADYQFSSDYLETNARFINIIEQYYSKVQDKALHDMDLTEVKKNARLTMINANHALESCLKTFNKVDSKLIAALAEKLIHDLIQQDEMQILNVADKFWYHVTVSTYNSPFSMSAHFMQPLLNYVGLIAHSPDYAGYQLCFSDHIPVIYTINTGNLGKQMKAEIMKAKNQNNENQIIV